MQKTVPEDGLVEKSTGRKIFEDMHIDELSKEIANRDQGFGIAEMLYEQFKNGYISW
nr:rod-binding protein [Clostridium sp. Cult2]